MIPYIWVCQVELTNVEKSLAGQRVVSHQGVSCVDEQTLSADRYWATCHLHVHHVLLLRGQITMIVATIHCNKKKPTKHTNMSLWLRTLYSDYCFVYSSSISLQNSSKWCGSRKERFHMEAKSNCKGIWICELWLFISYFKFCDYFTLCNLTQKNLVW